MHTSRYVRCRLGFDLSSLRSEMNAKVGWREHGISNIFLIIVFCILPGNQLMLAKFTNSIYEADILLLLMCAIKDHILTSYICDCTTRLCGCFNKTIWLINNSMCFFGLKWCRLQIKTLIHAVDHYFRPILASFSDHHFSNQPFWIHTRIILYLVHAPIAVIHRFPVFLP